LKREGGVSCRKKTKRRESSLSEARHLERKGYVRSKKGLGGGEEGSNTGKENHGKGGAVS